MKYLYLILVFGLIACGPQGAQGPAGSNGSNGTNGTSPTMVQFCTNVTGSYGTFPEYGFCINNTLYATYWNGTDAWTAEIYPGNYESTATGLQCNFTVGNNCSISDY